MHSHFREIKRLYIHETIAYMYRDAVLAGAETARALRLTPAGVKKV
jgi:hypothetical protein